MTTIKVFGEHDANTRRLLDNLNLALSAYPTHSKVVEISEPNLISAGGIQAMPALMMDGEVVAQGAVPSVKELTDLFQNRQLFKSKLFRLRSITVPVDISQPSENALLYAWQLARKFDAKLEVVYAMDSIFEGTVPSSSGFLSGYKKTVQTELDDFIREALKKIGVEYRSPAQMPSAPGAGGSVPVPAIHSSVQYGFPEEVIQNCSRKTDLIVMGTSGRGGVTRNLFGSTSTEVSYNAHCAVLFVPPNAIFNGFNNVVYASNFDSLDTLRIKQAVTFAQRFGGCVHFVHVGPAGERGMELENKLFEINYEHSAPDHPFLFANIVGEDVVEQLNEYAFNNRVDLMVFVTHHRGFWENLLHKSITREAVLGAGLPVLVLHSDNDMAS